MLEVSLLLLTRHMCQIKVVGNMVRESCSDFEVQICRVSISDVEMNPFILLLTHNRPKLSFDICLES